MTSRYVHAADAVSLSAADAWRIARSTHARSGDTVAFSSRLIANENPTPDAPGPANAGLLWIAPPIDRRERG